MADIKKAFPDNRLKDLQSAFLIFDQNKDGKITKDELQSVLEEAGADFTTNQIETFMKRVDADGNGSIDYHEFCSIMKDIVSTADQVETKFDAAFHAMDLDGDGKISQSELQQAVRELGDELSDQEALEIIKTVDKDGDGHINYEG
ncbi:DgyrCDS3470 [Dimorphilus gyrociliatus]|uniref:DgyrCDS3470 n=1 Tax=Dimorphilus gyrociliatus TaxID=2664684 RepID=A0A7I8VDA1_9ANNE|nr:DgyrCDS3470 [Dimorphilus gyrociliatus]